MQVEKRGRELKVMRVYNAPRQLVFEAHASCEHLRQWWGPRTWPMDECTLDFREGGVWHYCLRGPNEGDESWGRAEYREIVVPERIVYVDAFSGPEGDPDTELPQVLSTLEFVELDGKTRVMGHALYSSAEELNTVLEMGMVEGITETLDRLEEHLAKLQEDPD